MGSPGKVVSPFAPRKGVLSRSERRQGCKVAHYARIVGYWRTWQTAGRSQMRTVKSSLPPVASRFPSGLKAAP